MNEHITVLNLVLNEVQPKFSSLLRRASKILKFVKNKTSPKFKFRPSFNITYPTQAIIRQILIQKG